MSIKAIDLFCGGGGSSAGATEAGVTMVGAVDAWDIATAIYRDNFPSASANVRTTRLDDNSGADLFHDLGKVDLLMASPECTHHSVARGAKPRDEASLRSGWHVMRFIEDLEPRYLVLENVSRMKGWPGFEDMLKELRRHGYKLRLQELDAADFGVPQKRKRLFIVGDRLADPATVQPVNYRTASAAEILAPSGVYRSKPLEREGRAVNTLARAQRGMEALGRNKDFLLVYYGSDGSGGWQRLDRPLRTLTTLDRFGLVTWQDGIAYLRMLQVPELTKAMGLPEWFRLNQGSRRDRIRVLGNGVCAPVMQAVVESLIGSRRSFQVAAE